MGMRIKIPRLTVQVKYLTLIAAVVLATSLVLSAYYYYAARNKAIVELQAKGTTLTINLALNSEEGVLFSDTRHLSLLITLLREDSDVVGAEIVSTEGNKLVSNAEDMRFLNPEDDTFAREVDNSLNEETGTQMQRYRVLENSVQLLEFSAPITTQRIARDREELGLMFEGEADAGQGGQEVRIGSARIILSSARSFGELQKIQRNIIYITTIVALVGILITIPLVRITIRPIRQLAEGTKKIAEGDLSQRVAPTSRDEIGDLAESFNQMAVDLEKYHEELTQYSRTLEERVRERTHELRKSNDGLALANAELRKAQAQLIQAGKMAAMGEFGAGVAHELNQPLAGIKGYTQLLLTMVDEDSPLRPRLLQIDKQASRMKEITETMWNLARQSNFEYSFIDIRQPIKDSLILISEQFRQRQIEILSEIEEDLPRIYGDANQLHQVFLNFLTNAKDAFDENEAGIVRIDVAPIANRRYVEVVVMDIGIGIPPDIISEIFNPFFTTKPPGKGTGLGLSINFSIIEQHNGFMNVYSEESVGTAFCVTLPTEKFAACSKDGKETDGHPFAPCWVTRPNASGATEMRKPECSSCETFVRYQAPPESSLTAKFRSFVAECSSASPEN
jgi:signal transduction histidine kinase